MGKLPLVKQFQRMDNFPLEDKQVFDTLAELEDYALNYPTAYEGQICSVKGNPLATSYIINADKSVSQTGGSVEVKKKIQIFTPTEGQVEFLVTEFTLIENEFQVFQGGAEQTDNIEPFNGQIITFFGAVEGVPLRVTNLS